MLHHNVVAHLRKYMKMAFFKLLIKWTTNVARVMTGYLTKLLKLFF